MRRLGLTARAAWSSCIVALAACSWPPMCGASLLSWRDMVQLCSFGVVSVTLATKSSYTHITRALLLQQSASSRAWAMPSQSHQGCPRERSTSFAVRSSDSMSQSFSGCRCAWHTLRSRARPSIGRSGFSWRLRGRLAWCGLGQRSSRSLQASRKRSALACVFRDCSGRSFSPCTARSWMPPYGLRSSVEATLANVEMSAACASMWSCDYTQPPELLHW
mmetsp:Transcript_11012/g.27603  ORF Transcript_11012/g.27603 Transcript_11012/m.27603 type:complete len:219 (+) Transcript_11012:149-805(+)